MRARLGSAFSSKVRKIVCSAVFLVILFLVFSHITYLFRNTDYDRDHMVGIKGEEHLDMVYIGGSAAFTYWQPLKAWNDCGFTSYLYATNTIQAENIKSYIEECEQYHHPVLYVIDARAFQYYSDNPEEVGLRNGSDGMDITSLARYHMINDYFTHRNFEETESNSDILTYYFDIAKYHTNVSNLSSQKAWGFVNNKGISSNKGWEWITFAYHEYLKTPKFRTDERAELLKNDKNTLEDLLTYCKARDIDILLVVCPYNISVEDQKKYNSIKDITEQYGFGFLNANEHYDEIGIDFGLHFYNGSHTNALGAAAYTSYLEDYIIDHYSMPDHRDDANYSSWDSDYQRYKAEEEGHVPQILNDIAAKIRGKYRILEAKNTENFTDWYKLVSEGNFDLLITSTGDFRWPSSMSEQQALKDLGLTFNRHAIRMVNGANITYSNTEDNAESLIKEGTIGNTSYSFGFDQAGHSFLNVDNKKYQLSDIGINVTVLDRNFKTIAAQFLIETDEDGNLTVKNRSYLLGRIIQENYGIDCKEIDDEDSNVVELSSSSHRVSDQYRGKQGIACIPVYGDAFSFTSDDGFTVSIDDVTSLCSLLFFGKKLTSDGCPYAIIYDEEGNEIDRFVANTSDCGNEWNQYCINLALLKGKVTIVFSGGITNMVNNNEDAFVFSNFLIY